MGKVAWRFVQAFYLLGTFGVVLAAILAALGYALPWLDALNHLQPVWFLGTLLALITSVVFFRRGMMRAVVLSLTGTGFLASAMIVVPEVLETFAPRPPAPAGAVQYRVLTYNIFGLNYDMKRVAAMIGREKPDIVAIQEFFPGQRNGLHPLLKKNYPYFVVCDHKTKRGNVALYARMPFTFALNEACVNDPRYGTSIIAARFTPKDGSKDGSPFTVVTTHLDWPVQLSKWRTKGNLMARLDATYRRKSNEYAQLTDQLRKLAGPLILVGDFNATSWSYSLRGFALRNGLDRQTRALLTYPKRLYLGGWRDVPAFLPIDQVMVRNGVQVHAIRAGDPAGSDHKPLITDFTIAPVHPSR